MKGARGFTGRAGGPESLASTGAIESLGSRALKKNMQPRFLYPSPPCEAPLKKFRGALELIKIPNSGNKHAGTLNRQGRLTAKKESLSLSTEALL